LAESTSKEEPEKEKYEYTEARGLINTLKQKRDLWDLFTKKEEYYPSFLDEYQRFPYYLSKYRSILEPRVSEFLVENGFNLEYPEDKEFAVCLSHDVDSVSYSKLWFYVARSLVNYQTKGVLKTAFNKMAKKLNPLCNFRQIMELEKKYGAKSSFYFLASDEEYENFSFRIEDLENELRNIVDQGWEIGLHGGSRAYNDLNRVREEKKRLEEVLGRKLIGCRNHFLKFKVPDTWELLCKAGFKYDTTFGYADMVGFRNGMCHPFEPYNLKTNKIIDILEIPLTIMDATLFERYLKLDLKGAWEITKVLIETVRKYGGVITILWHNSSMIGDNLMFYEKILEYCHEKNAWLTSGEDIWKFWKRLS
jgi:peptidoglycan/xylan/chitin deacetylase (PgdA/CDA1 family)